MHWLPNGFQSLRLDIVGFLAILGEASVKANAQVATLSPLSLLPRLLPAPQALIRTSRPESLQPDTGKVIGARSGSTRAFVNHIAHLLHSQDPLPAYSVRCERIIKSNPSASVSAARFGPIVWLELLGATMSLTLLAVSIKSNDGFAMLTTILLSLLSSLIGLGSRWSLSLMKRRQKRRVPEDQIIIVYPRGAFLVVNCDENIARELYWHPEECKYKYGNTLYRLLSLIGTITLMFGVICLANATLELQIAFAAAYMILNAAYWVVAALPPQWHWDLSCYVVERGCDEGHENFTQALWGSIKITRGIEWVKIGRVAPVSEAWRMWVEMAGDVVARGEEAEGEKGKGRMVDEWDAEGALTDFLNPAEKGLNV